MRAPTATEILETWEAGVRLRPAERAVLLVALARPGTDAETLWDLELGERNRILFDWYRDWIGPRFECQLRCGHCRTENEFAIPVAEIRRPPTAQAVAALEIDGIAVRFRPPNGRDLAAAAEGVDVAASRRRLIELCILSAKAGDRSIPAGELSEAVLTAVSESLRESDPSVDQRIEIVCVDCERTTEALFDVTQFAWNELSRWAKRCLVDVHRLARAYGWREADILAMSQRRRQAYLELAQP